MNTNNINITLWLDIGYGLRLGEHQGCWFVSSANGLFALSSDSDYFRAVTILEMEYQNAKSLLDKYTEENKIKHAFSIAKIVNIGLAAQSDSWAEKALTWVKHLPIDLRQSLLTNIETVINAKWASQRTRQLAMKEAKSIKFDSASK